MKKSRLLRVVGSFAAIICIVFPASAARAEDPFDKMLSDDDFEAALFSKFGVSFPVYLGCNRGPNLDPELPITCRFEGTEIQVSEVGYSGITIGPAMEVLEDTNGWVDLVLAIDAIQGSKLISWSVEPRMIWVAQTYGRTILCLHGRAQESKTQSGLKIYQAADCISVNHSTDQPSLERTLRVKFFDTGKVNALLDSEQTDPSEFQSTVAFFMHRAYAIPSLGPQE